MKNISLILLLIIMVSACTEKVDIKLDETYDRLVVEGNITTDTTTHIVTLTRSTNYYYNEEPPAVTGALVKITDSDGTSITLDEVESGVYSTGPGYFAIAGKTYTLDINLDAEINGYTEFQASSFVPPIDDVDSIGLGFYEDWGDEGYVEVQCYYQDPLTKEFYMFDIYKNKDHLTDTITKRSVTDDEFFNGNYTNGIGVGYLDQADKREKVSIGDTILFQASSITEEYANFIWTLQEEVGFSTPLFSGPPANVKSNVSNGALGFFAAYSVVYSTTIAREP